MRNEKSFQGIDTIIIRVSNVEKAKTWYQEKLQLTAIWQDPVARLVVLDTGGPTSLTLWQTSEPLHPNQSNAPFPIFKTLDANKAREELRSEGAEVGEVITDAAISWFRFYDPDGNVLEACQVRE